MLKKSITICIVILISFNIYSSITRDEVIEKAREFLNNEWSPTRDTCTINDYLGNKIGETFESYFDSGEIYTGIAYVWGGGDDISKFNSKISAGDCAGGYNTSSFGYFKPSDPSSMSAASHFLTGIDCAAFVNNCLMTPIGQGFIGLQNFCVQIGASKIQKGDVWAKSGHVRLSAGDNDIYESHAEELFYPGVDYWVAVSNIAYTPYSIFPQFSECTPKEGSTVAENDIEIGVTVRCKNLS